MGEICINLWNAMALGDSVGVGGTWEGASGTRGQVIACLVTVRVITSPRCPICIVQGRRDGSTADEPFAWESREFTRKMVVGKVRPWSAWTSGPWAAGRPLHCSAGGPHGRRGVQAAPLC